MSKTYPIAENGEWVQPARRGFRISCCSCGLVHRINYRIVDSANGRGKTIQFQIFRDERATGQIHRHMKKAEK